MPDLEIISRDGKHRIQSLEDWRLWCRPQPDKHWKDGFSAKECAKAWFRTGRPAVPAELLLLFDTHPRTAGLSITQAIPELQTPFNGTKGRGHDVVLRGQAAEGPVLVTIEAKARETFGARMGSAYATSKAMRSKKSKKWERIECLVSALFPAASISDEEIRALPVTFNDKWR